MAVFFGLPMTEEFKLDDPSSVWGIDIQVKKIIMILIKFKSIFIIFIIDLIYLNFLKLLANPIKIKIL